MSIETISESTVTASDECAGTQMAAACVAVTFCKDAVNLGAQRFFRALNLFLCNNACCILIECVTFCGFPFFLVIR